VLAADPLLAAALLGLLPEAAQLGEAILEAHGRDLAV
jgi:hypothetical protein